LCAVLQVFEMNALCDSISEFVHRAKASLEEAFGASFLLWSFHDGWHDVADCADSEDATPDLAQQPPAEFIALLNEARLSGEVCCQDGPGGVVLAIPLQASGTSGVVATARFRDAPQALLLRFARVFRRNFSERYDLETLRHENEDFVRQVTNDFEEMAFLRNLTDLLEYSDFSADLPTVAASVLPILMPLIQADAILLFEAECQKAGDAGVTAVSERPRCIEGECQVDPQVCHALVAQYQDRAHDHPLIGNFPPSQANSDFPGVRDFILAAVRNGTQTLGWLLAVNRNLEDDLYADAPWRMSCAEFGTHEATLLGSSCTILAIHARNMQLFRERESLHLSVVSALASAIEAKDEYTRGHSERVALFAQRIAQAMGHNEDFCRQIYLSGLLHDIGKIGIRDAVLCKPGVLTDEEFNEIQQHPELGWGILADVEHLQDCLPGVLHHHEQYDGRGYPDGLAGRQIPLKGRIIAVADAYDAMTSDRSYRPGMPHEQAVAILREGAGQQWDPQVVNAFLETLPVILWIKKNYRPSEPRRRRPERNTEAPVEQENESLAPALAPA
jgi:hypothetical protein